MILFLACQPEEPTNLPPEPTETPHTGSVSAPFVAEPGSTVLVGVYVFDALGPRGPVSVVLTGSTIAAVLDGAVIPENATPLSGVDGRWVVPGLVDPHVHLFLSGTASWVGDPLPSALTATITHGVTTAVDVGSPAIAYALRERIRAGDILGPDLYTLGPMVTTLGAHPCETVYDPEWCTFVSSEVEAKAAAAARADADGVKLAIADASFTPWPTPRIDPAHAALAAQVSGWVVAHVDEDEDVTIALDAGATHLAHPVFGGSLLDDTVSDVLLAGAYVHTTLGAFAGVLELLDGTLPTEVAGGDPRVQEVWEAVRENPSSVDPAWVEGSEAWLAAAERSLLALDAAGVPLLPASDAGYLYVPHGLGLHLELQRLAALGFDPADLIVAATAGNATALGLTDRGTVTVGARADLLVVASDPRTDLEVLAAPEWVVLAGVPHDKPAQEDVLVTRARGEVGNFCLDERDCPLLMCDLVQHRCAEACLTPGDPTETCGPDTWCAAADGLTSAPACRTVRTCDWMDPASCAPAPYAERCAPLDLDTSGCFPAGPRGDGEPCSPIVTESTCGPGLICTVDDFTCHRPCSGQPDCAADETCVGVTIGGVPWFGTCR